MTPTHCPTGHELGPGRVLVGHTACTGHDGGESKTIFKISQAPSGGLSLSPDGRFLLYSQFDKSSAEILLVENFQ